MREIRWKEATHGDSCECNLCRNDPSRDYVDVLPISDGGGGVKAWIVAVGRISGSGMREVDRYDDLGDALDAAGEYCDCAGVSMSPWTFSLYQRYVSYHGE